jgi:glycosyltransferase involved in cell wall biosynthesis
VYSVDLVARPVSSPTGVGRYAAALQRELLTLGVDAQLRPTFSATVLPTLTAWTRKRGFDAQAFLASYPPLVPHRRHALLHLTAQTFASALWLQPGAVVTVHDLFPGEGGRRATVTRLVDGLSRLGLRRASAIVTGSQATAAICRARGLGGPYGVTAASYGVDHGVFRRRPVPERFAASLALPVGASVLLYVGTEARRKRFELLVHLLARLRHGPVPNTVLLKVGAATDMARREELRALAGALDVTDGIRWLDRVTERQLVWLYNLAHVYVSAAEREGFGLPILEAMACGCPVVATDLAPHREIVNRTGELIQVGDEAALERAVAALLRESERREALGELAVERAALFTWRRTAEAVAAVYERVSRH